MVSLKQEGSSFVVNYYLQILHGYLQTPCTLKADLELNQNIHTQVQNQKNNLIQKLKELNSAIQVEQKKFQWWNI